MTNEKQIQAILEQLIATVAFLCDETASLVEEKVSRTPADRQEGVHGKALKIREIADSLRAMPNTLT